MLAHGFHCSAISADNKLNVPVDVGTVILRQKTSTTGVIFRLCLEMHIPHL